MSREEEFRRDFPGLETYIYNFAYIFKYAKVHNIDINGYTDESCKEKIYSDKETPDAWYGYFSVVLDEEMKKDTLLNVAIEGFKGNYSEIYYPGLFQFFDEMNVDELTNIALWNIDTSIYNSGTPDSLVKLAYSILESSNDKKNIMDFGTNNGNFLVYYAKNNPNYIFNGIEINSEAAEITKLRLGLLGVEERVRIADEFMCCNEAYDKLFSNHPFLPKVTPIMIDTINNTKGIDYDFNVQTSSDWFFVEKARQFIGYGGKAVCVVLNSSLSKMTDSLLRKKLVDDGWIESIISLPSKIFSYSTISCSLVILSSNNKSVRMIDATHLYDAERRINNIRVKDVMDIYESINPDTENSKLVSYEELSKNDFVLNVENYLDNYKVELINPVSLDSVSTDIFRGYQITAKEMDEYVKSDKSFRRYKILNVGNINDGFIDYELDSIYVNNDKLDKYLIKNGDILISCKSSKIKIALFEEHEQDNIIASGNLIVIRPNQEKIVPAYLKMFLDSDKGLKLLNSIQTGAAIISINPSALKNMNISLLDYDYQVHLANSYMSKLDNLNMYKKRIIDLENEIKNFSNEKF